MISSTTSALLRELAIRYETPDFIKGDPSWWMHQVDGDDNREALAFVAASLSYGSRKQFMPKIEELLHLSEGNMVYWLASKAYAEHFSSSDGNCFYRLYSRATMRLLFDAYSTLLTECGSLKKLVHKNGDGTTLQAISTICQWFACHGASIAIPKDTSSACKRICMFLRWMVRSNSPVDLGIWSDIIDRRSLIMPLDTHVIQEARRLSLPVGASATMASAKRLTSAMCEVFPDDPLKADFALFGLGVDVQ